MPDPKPQQLPSERINYRMRGTYVREVMGAILDEHHRAIEALVKANNERLYTSAADVAPLASPPAETADAVEMLAQLRADDLADDDTWEPGVISERVTRIIAAIEAERDAKRNLHRIITDQEKQRESLASALAAEKRAHEETRETAERWFERCRAIELALGLDIACGAGAAVKAISDLRAKLEAEQCAHAETRERWLASDKTRRATISDLRAKLDAKEHEYAAAIELARKVPAEFRKMGDEIVDLRAKLEEAKEKLTWSQANRDGMWLDSINRACGTAFNDKESAVMHVISERQRREEAESERDECGEHYRDLLRLLEAGSHEDALLAIQRLNDDRDDCACELERVSAVAEAERKGREEAEETCRETMAVNAQLLARLRSTSGDGLRAAVERLRDKCDREHAELGTEEVAGRAWGAFAHLLRTLLAAHPAPQSTPPAEPKREAGEVCERCKAFGHTTPCIGCHTAEPKRYIPWANAGGPNECKHGYAAGIPCPDCDREKAAEPKLDDFEKRIHVDAPSVRAGRSVRTAEPKREAEIPGVTFDELGRARIETECKGVFTHFGIRSEHMRFHPLGIDVYDVTPGGMAQAPAFSRETLERSVIPLLQRFVDTGKLTNGGDK